MPARTPYDELMSDEPHHECGFALLRLLKPPEYYEEKYGTCFFGLNRMYMLMEKQRNRGQDGCGVASVKLDVAPGTRYIHCEKSIEKDPIADVFTRVQKMANEKLKKAPADARIGGDKPGEGASRIDPHWVKDNVPFAGEVFIAHVRYGTDSDNTIDRCHPFVRESNWMTRNLLLAGNFNITNNEDLFQSLVQIGQHPRELSDTVMLLEKIGHFVDKENNDMYVKYSATGQAPRTCFSLIAENLNVAQILRRASTDWDGGYCIAGVLGHGDAFCMRDPSGIRPAFYLANDEVVVVASEAPLIQTVFNVKEHEVHPLPPGQAMVVKRSGHWSLQKVLPPKPLKQCSFERIYFSRGNDAGVYRERERLGRLMLPALVKMLQEGGDSLGNAVLSFIPNTSELAYLGLVKEAQDEMARQRTQVLLQMQGKSGPELEAAIEKTNAMCVRTEKVVHKDAKIRTFIQEDSSREHLTMHAYDVHYGTVRAGEDVLVALDDSIVRGNTLKNAILRTLDRLGPKRIIVLSSCPQIRYPDVYGIDMAKMGDLAAFKAAITLLQESGRGQVITDVYRACREQLGRPLNSGEFVNHVKRIYDPFTPEEISAKIVQQIRPSDCHAEIGVLFNTVDALHEAMPEHSGDWYFTGDYPTNGGVKVCCRAFVLWMEGSSARCYGVSSAASIALSSVLVAGDGGSEHALAWKISQSYDVGRVFVAPGNAGTNGTHSCAKTPVQKDETSPLIQVDIPFNPPHFAEVKAFCRENGVALVVLGAVSGGLSEAQLASEGMGDVLRQDGVKVFGPSAAADEIESSEGFMRAFAERHGVPILSVPLESVGEDWARGCEVSVLALSDGSSYKMLPFAVHDQKWALDDDRGLRTDGMGAFVPSPLVCPDMLERIEREVVQPVLEGLRKEGRPFVGCLHTELAIAPTGPKVLRFRCRMGDPVGQAALRLLEGDTYGILAACAAGRLAEAKVAIRENTSVVAVVMASGGYPGSYRRGHPVTGVERALCVPGTTVFHSGTTVLGERSARALRRSFSGMHQEPPAASQRIMTNGGRVLTVVSVGRGLHEARERAYVGVRAISFNDAWYRHDVAALASLVSSPRRNSSCSDIFIVPSTPQASTAGASGLTYRAAGVDRSACQAAVASFEPLAARTVREGSGHESGPLWAALRGKVHEVAKDEIPYLLVSSTSAVGTKLRLAAHAKHFDSLGVDLVALCANDVAARGAEPLFFHEHISTNKVDAEQAMQMVRGVAEGCVEAGCTLLDTGVAELPGVFAQGGGSDFVGFAVGRVERGGLLPRHGAMVAGDALIALPSSGLHSNGFSLVRFIIRAAGLDYNQAAPFDPTRSLGDALLTPARIYVQPLLALSREGLLKGAAPVASGGLQRCCDGVLPEHLVAKLQADAWEMPAAQRWLAAVGKVKCSELAATFNCGIGMLLVVAAADRERAMQALRDLHEEPVLVGELGSRKADSLPLEVEGADLAWLMLPELGASLPFPEVLSSLQDPWTISRKKVVVLGGREEVSPLQALVQALALPASAADLSAFVCPYPDSPLLAHARNMGLQATVLGKGQFASTEFYCEGLEGLDSGAGEDAEGGGPAPGTGADDGAGQGSSSISADFSRQFDELMTSLTPDFIVVLDDVDRTLLTRQLLQRYMGRVLLVHASLLPAFPGPCPIEAALRAGVCITGCTVSFAAPPSSLGAEHRHGPVILQEATKVHANDTASTLRARLVAECEAAALSRAVQLVASGSVVLKSDDGGYSLGRSASFTEAASDDMLGGGLVSGARKSAH